MGLQIRRPPAPRLAPHRRYFPIPRAEPSTSSTGWGLYAGEPEACRRSLRQFLPILAHLGALVYLFVSYRVEGRGFQVLAGVALGALPIHYALPLRWKRPFFVAASIVGLFLVFGGVAGVVVLLGAAALIALASLPIRWGGRVALVAVAGVALGFARVGRLLPGVPETAWIVLGSMFLFRMIVYLYETKHAEGRESPVDTLSYFFLLPNYAFLLFPVVDYRGLRRSHFAREVHATQAAGLRLMFQGTMQLLLYRVIYHQLAAGPESVRGFSTLVLYLVTNSFLYLHVSGQFHMACGMLHLFGYALPDTHRNYFLATSFTDYWRRINIYWKDFMVRVVFNPVAFRLKRRPEWVRLAVATVVVFGVTWVLHAYQSFWLKGTWGFSVPDAMFWGVLGALVLVNVQLDARKVRRCKSAAGPRHHAVALRLAKTAGTFATISVLWSLWSSPSLEDWLAMLRRGLAAG